MKNQVTSSGLSEFICRSISNIQLYDNNKSMRMYTDDENLVRNITPQDFPIKTVTSISVPVFF